MIARNVSGSAVEISDLGITLAIGEDRPLQPHRNTVQVAASLDLRTAINDDKVLLINGSGLLLSKQQSLTLARRGFEQSLPRSYVNGFQCKFKSVTEVDIGVGEARDNLDDYDLITSGVLTVDITTDLDTGVEAGDTWYGIFVIGDSNNVEVVKGLLSTSYDNPTLPAGYDRFRRVGWVRNNGSSDFIRFEQLGIDQTRLVVYDESNGSQKILDNGSATVNTVVSAQNFCPVTARLAIAQIRFRTGATGVNTDNLTMKPKGSTTNWMRVQTGVVSNKATYSQISLFLDAEQKIEYKVQDTPNRATISILGYTDVL